MNSQQEMGYVQKTIFTRAANPSEMMLTTTWPVWVYRLEWLAVGVLSAGSLMLFLLAFMLE